MSMYGHQNECGMGDGAQTAKGFFADMRAHQVAGSQLGGFAATKSERSPLHALAEAQALAREACSAVLALADEFVGADPTKDPGESPNGPGLLGALDGTARDIAVSSRLILAGVQRIRSQLP